MTLQDDILLAQLQSQLKIEQARYKSQRNFSMNTDMQVASKVTADVIKEIEFQINDIKNKPA